MHNSYRVTGRTSRHSAIQDALERFKEDFDPQHWHLDSVSQTTDGSYVVSFQSPAPDRYESMDMSQAELRMSQDMAGDVLEYKRPVLQRITVPLVHRPYRDDGVDAWLKERRDALGVGSPEWHALDDTLDAYRLAADTGEMW